MTEQNIAKMAQDELDVLKLKAQIFDLVKQQEILQMQHNQLQQLKAQVLKQLSDVEARIEKEKKDAGIVKPVK